MKYFLCCAAILVIFMSSCKQGTQKGNPLLAEFNTPFQVPPFDKIDTSDYYPAYLEGMKQQMAEIDAIVNDAREPDFNNTILAMDRSGKLLTRIEKIFSNLDEANTNPQLQALARKMSPILSKHQDDILLNDKLFARIKAVYEKRSTMGLDSQQIRVIEKYYNDFVRQGANLAKEQKDTLRKINADLSMLQITFGENLLAETNESFRLVIEDKKDLDGLPDDVIAAAAEMAKEKKMEGKWLFTLSKASMLPFLQYSTRRDLREKIYRAYFMRGDNNNKNDNKATIVKIINLRVKRAQLLGYKNFAAFVTADKMSKTPENVMEFLMKIWTPALQVAKTEVADMQKNIDKEGGKFKLMPWDWWYYAEKVRKEKYDLDENQLKPYFSLQNVREGMFHVANKLYGITFTQRTDIPVYQKDVEAYEVKEANGDHLGVLYLDYFPRESKRGGAWCTDFRSALEEDGKLITPVISIVTNVSRPTKDAPALLTWEETTTLFHEFGHSLHGFFSRGKYIRTAGDVPHDYVELPSQVMENWAGEPEVLRFYAKNYKTGEVIPDKLIEKIRNSGHFNQGFITVEYLAAALLDMDYHLLTAPLTEDVNAFEKKSMEAIGLIPEILPRYRSEYFAHIFSGGYSAGYYDYIWAEVLDADAFHAFKESGDIYNPQLAAKFRKYCLAECGSGDAMGQYVKFRGNLPSIEPLLEKRGLK
jgi:peptidyl-dipeptidase Dcp